VAPWQVWWINFDPQVGREQAGLRPGIVVGSAYACALPNGLALVVPCTSTDRDLPFQPVIDLAGRAGVAMCDQVKAVSLGRFVRPHQAATLTGDARAAIAFVLLQLFDVSPAAPPG
jgi:mRNA interferase MazF